MRRAANFVPVLAAGLLALAGLAWLHGCGNESRPSRPGAAGLQVRLVFPDKAQAKRADHTLGPASVQSIHVSAWELPGGGSPRVLRDSTTAVIAPGDTRYRLELQVPPAALYLLEVKANGTIDVSPNATGVGLLYFGADSVANLAAGETRTLEIQMRRVVPALTGTTTATSLRLQWSQVARALRYGLLETPAPPALPRETFTRNTDTLIVFPPHKAMAPEQKSYRVRAELPDNLFSAFSDSVGVSIPEPVAPARIEDLAVSLGTSTVLQLEWTATGNDGTVGQALEYDLRRAGAPITTEADFSAATRVGGLPAPQTAGAHERFNVTGLDPATDYYFAIKAGDAVPLWSPLSNSAHGATLPLAPTAPTDLTASAISDHVIGLRWTDRANNETRYLIQRQAPTDSGFVRAGVLNGSFTGTVAFQDSNLVERTSYRYRVRAENAGGASAWSNVVAQRTRVTRPTNLAATAVTPDSVALTWSFPRPDPTDGFRLERNSVTPSKAWTEIGRPAPASRAFGDGSVHPLNTYLYRLRAVDRGDVSEPSDSVEVTTPDRPPVCRVAPTVLDFGTVFVASSVDRSFLVTNIGGGHLTGTVATTCPGFSIVGGAGDFSLGAGDSVRVTVRFSPTSSGSAGCTITPARNCSSVSCTGVGEALPACTLSPQALEFGTIPVGSFADSSFTITNTGGGILSGTVALSDCPEFTIISNGGDFTLGAGSYRVVRIRFAPTSPGPAQCVITPTGGCSPITFSGTGEALPLCSVVPTSLDFGTVPVTLDSLRTFTISNIGGGTLVGNVTADCGDYSIVRGAGTFRLAAGAVDSVTVRFAPTVEQPDPCTISLGKQGCSSVSCTGIGEAHPICSLNSGGLDFGLVPIGRYAEGSFTITNTGGGQLEVGVGTDCDKVFAVTAGAGVFSLGPGVSHAVTVRFTPVSTAPAACTFIFQRIGNFGCPDLPCTGTGQGPVCSLSTTSLDFGTIEAGQTATRTFTITNIGGGSLTGSVLAHCSDFSLQTGGGSYDLGPGASTTVTVLYAPTAPGVEACQVLTGCGNGVSCTGAATNPNDHWWPGFAGNAPNGGLNTLAIDGTRLAVGGTLSFNMVGTSSTAHLAWWDGSGWTTTGDFTWNDLRVLQAWPGPVGQGTLVGTGLASDFPGFPVGQLVNGGWNFLGQAFELGDVKLLATWQNNIYVGGSFTFPIAHLGYWSGSNWAQADQGFIGDSMNDLQDFGGTLYAAGSYPTGPTFGGGAIYRLNGSVWSVVTASINGAPLTSARKLTTYAGALYAIVDAGPADYVARLDGTNLVPVGESVDGLAADLASDGTKLYVVGTFVKMEGAIPSGVVNSGVASWDGSNWSALGSGITWTPGQTGPAAVLPYGGSIYVAGEFISAGLKDSPNIARWIP